MSFLNLYSLLCPDLQWKPTKITSCVGSARLAFSHFHFFSFWNTWLDVSMDFLNRDSRMEISYVLQFFINKLLTVLLVRESPFFMKTSYIINIVILSVEKIFRIHAVSKICMSQWNYIWPIESMSQHCKSPLEKTLLLDQWNAICILWVNQATIDYRHWQWTHPLYLHPFSLLFISWSTH